MELQYYGGNCIRISTKKAGIVVDDNLVALGVKSIAKPGDVMLFTGASSAAPLDAKLVIQEPGEYEVSDISIKGIAARAHMDEEGKQSATMFKIIVDDVRIAVVGHVHPDLSSAQLENLGTIDVLIIPTGGSGYTLDPVGALKLIKEIEPKVVIPTHYAEKGINYEVPQQSLEEVVKGLSMEPRETTAKLKVKAGELGDTTQLVILEKQ